MAIPRWLWLSPRISAASPNARLLLVELLSMFNGRNNGELFLSVRDATHRIGLADFRATLAAFEELQELKLIEKTFVGFFAVKAGECRASAWRLTWIGEDGRASFSDRWRVIGVNDLSDRSRKRLERRQSVLDRYLKGLRRGRISVVDSSTVQARSVEVSTTLRSPSVEKSSTPIICPRENDLGQPRAESTTHILYHGDQGLAVEFIRNDLFNFWRAADDGSKKEFASAVSLGSASIEAAIRGGDIDSESWLLIREKLALEMG
jgi:hypothetical protein